MLERLCQDLDRHLLEDPRGARVARLLEEYARTADDWRNFALFGADYYSRNLLHRNDLYELIVLCWNVGQRSPIHDHARQRCWMAVLEGSVCETLYRVTDVDCRAVPGATRQFEPGSVAFIVDEIGWHRNEPAAQRAAVTLHLYSKPIGECRIFDETSGRALQRKLSYHSIRGQLTGAHT
jgi:cysteine dioxygenase